MPPKKGKAPSKRSGATKSVPASRRARAEELRHQRERRSLRNRLVFVAVLLVLVGGVFYVASRDDPPAVESTVCEQDSEHDPERNPIHIDNPTYEVSPPAGGSHTPDAAQPGFYRDQGSRPLPTDGQLVHAMEHGFVILWYQPTLPAEEMATLERVSDQRGRELIVVPRRSLGGPIAVTAWHRRLLCSSIDATAVDQFVERYRDKGPESGFL